MDVGCATFPFFITSKASCCVTVIFTLTVMVTTLRRAHRPRPAALPGGPPIVYVCFGAADSVSVLSYLTEKRGDSVRGLLLESETDMRSTHGNINVAKRRCALGKKKD